MSEHQFGKHSTIVVTDARPTEPDGRIPMAKAKTGHFYETKSGAVVMAVSVPATFYRQETGTDIAFLGMDGLVFPFVSERIRPLKASMHVTIHRNVDPEEV